MKGPQFLILYFAIEVLLIGAAYIFIRSLTKKADDVLVASPEVLPVAYLAGGMNHLTYTILFRLHLLDLIKFSKRHHNAELKKVSDSIPEPCDKLLYMELAGRTDIKELNSARIKNKLKDTIEQHVFFSKNPGLLFTESTHRLVTRIRNAVMIILFAILAYRVVSGVMAGMHKFLYLFILAAVGMIAAWNVLRISGNTRAGWMYILHLKTMNPFPSKQVFNAATDSQKSLYLALYGSQILDHMGWNNLHKNYETTPKRKVHHHSASSSSCSSSSCSSSSSSSCGSGDSGSSCSGCGGCGGGD